MKPASRKKATRKNTKPSPDVLRRYMQALSDEHHKAWQEELMEPAPYWTYLLALHLRIVELDHLEEAVQELL